MNCLYSVHIKVLYDKLDKQYFWSPLKTLMFFDLQRHRQHQSTCVWCKISRFNSLKVNNRKYRSTEYPSIISFLLVMCITTKNHIYENNKFIYYKYTRVRLKEHFG